MDALDRIRYLTEKNPVLLFIKGTATQPRSPQSLEALECLNDMIEYTEIIDITSDPEIRAFLPKYSEEQDTPQLYINGELVGGVRVISELSENGVLAEMVNTAIKQSTKLAS